MKKVAIIGGGIFGATVALKISEKFNVSLFEKSNNIPSVNVDKLNLKETLYLSPYHEQVTPYLLTILGEILNKYDVDGLHLDYIRYNNNNVNQD